MSILKRQRELRNAEKAARKRARRHGLPEPGQVEPRPTVAFSQETGADDTEAPTSGETAGPERDENF
jgi:hypothetical protein